MQDEYAYDANANVAGITDQQEGAFSRSMGYDGLDRLTAANAPGVWGNASYAYDAVDNLRVSIVGSRTNSLLYDSNNRLSSVITNGSTTGYGYDAQGNLTSKGGQSFTFDIGNRLASASIGGSYLYDGHGRRIRVASSDGSTRMQVYSQQGQLLWATSSGGPRPSSNTAFIYLGGKAIAEWNSASGVQYVHTDALGSPVAHTNGSAVVMNRTRFEPYGYVAQGIKPSADTSIVGFTGHVQDAETDLVYMQQRYYDPIAGRFLSVDPIVTDANTGKGFGLYTYVENNPYGSIDPDGRECFALNSSSPYCSRSATYKTFDAGVSRSTRFFGAAALTTRFLANLDIPVGSRAAGWFGVMPSSEARAFLGQVSAFLYDINVAAYRDIAGGKLSGAGLDAAMVSKEQSAVQKMLDALPGDQRGRIVESINNAFANRDLAVFDSDRAYGRILGGVEKTLGRAIDFGKQSDREAIGNALIKDLRQSGGCTATGTRISQC